MCSDDLSEVRNKNGEGIMPIYTYKCQEVETLKKLKIPFGVIINRADIGDIKVEDYCEKEKIPVLMRIPFKKEIAIAYSKGEPIIKVLPEYKRDFKNFFNKIKKEVEK
jgi:MinD superfamily P-loop ATPase